MKSYQYKALNSTNKHRFSKPVSGSIKAKDSDDAIEQIRGMGYLPTYVNSEEESSVKLWHGIVLFVILAIGMTCWTDRTLDYWISQAKGSPVDVPWFLSLVVTVLLNVVSVVVNLISEILRLAIYFSH